MEKGKPISTEAILLIKKELIPGFVFDVVNNLIAKNWNGARSVIKQKYIVADIIKYCEDNSITLSESGVYENKYLNFEELYRQQGWKVEYDKPGYNETYDASFTFSVRKN